MSDPKSIHRLPDPTAVVSEPLYPLVTSTFFSQADQKPDHPSLCQERDTWTYGQMARSCHALAGALMGQGMKKGDVIAVTGSGSFGLVSSMLAVLLGGGVVLPIDQGLPAQRQRLMMEESGAKYVLYINNSTRAHEEWSVMADPLRIFSVDRDTGQMDGTELFPAGQALNFPDLSPDDAAYIFFTSGTAGAPKGVVGCHKGLSHFLAWQRDTFAVGSQDRCAQLTNLSFDVVLRDIFLPLISGATICLPGKPDELAADKVLPWMEREKITLLHTVPSLARSWLKHLPGGVTLNSLRCVFFAGEPLTDSLVQKWRQIFPDSGRIVNLYGPTETTLAKCYYEIPARVQPGVQPIGTPLPHTQALVLSDNLDQCGIGEHGEIFLRTPYRTLGYINAPHDQQKSFIINPFRNDRQDILYRTGDRGRYRPDGLLEILGRLDDQVKIRGVRVEPEEVTAFISHHPKVSSSVVIARKNNEGEDVLIAYIVPSSHGEVSPSDLRLSLSSQLPAVMVPSHFVILEALPLTPNGKVDKRALPAPDIERPDTQEFIRPPGTHLEESLASVWRQVLGLKRVGMRDNFFELGGHSLTATQMASRIRRELDFEITVREIFEHPTIELLALYLIKEQVDPSAHEIMDEVLTQVESMSQDDMEGFLKQDGPAPGEDAGIPITREKAASSFSKFYCPRERSEFFGRHDCNLLIIINERFELSSFERVAHYVRELDPRINVSVVMDRTPMDLDLPNRFTLIFSPALVRNYPPVKGRMFCGQPLGKSEEYTALEKAGIPVPPWALLTEEETPDFSKFDDYVVRKPNYGGLGAKVVITRKNHVRWKPIITDAAGLSPSTIIQQFIYTGPRPVSYRVNTLFGKVLYANKYEASSDRPVLNGPQDFKSAAGISIVANAWSSRLELTYDEEIIGFAESAHAAFPEIPLLGFDILREVPTGKLYVSEANAIGYVWSIEIRQIGCSLEKQFDGVRKAAYILAEKTQRLACQASPRNDKQTGASKVGGGKNQ